MEFIRRNVNGGTATSANSGSNGGYTNVSGGSGTLETHTIFGQPYDGTNDVKGDLADVDNISANGDVALDGKIIIRGKDEDGAYTNENLEIARDDEDGTTISGGQKYTFDGNVIAPKFIGDLDAEVVNASEAIIDALTAQEGQIDQLSTDDLNAAKAYIQELLSDNITTENLTVTKSAHFFELIIDKIKAAGGAVLLTPADGFKVDKVAATSNGYKLYWKASVGSRKMANMWKVNDQAICQTFNAAEGTSYNVSNKYYWCLVTAIGTETIDEEDYHFIELSSTIKDGTLNPEEGDEIAMLGYRGTDDDSRQSAIYLAAYNSIDPTLKAPLIAHYKGINDFNLKNHKHTWFAANGNTIQGNLFIESGDNIEDLIDDVETKTNVEIRVYSVNGYLTLYQEREVDLYAEVWYNNENITDAIPAELFSWQRVSIDSDGDEVWNQSRVGIGSTIHLTDSDIWRRAQFFCVLNVDELKRRNIIA